MDLNAPDIVKEQWSTANKNVIADLFSKVNFNQDRYSGMQIIDQISIMVQRFLYKIYAYTGYDFISS